MNQNPNMNYNTMSGQEFIQRYPQGLQGYENITPQEFMREFPANNYETITPQEYFQKYAPPKTITPEEYFRRYPNSGRLQRFEKPLLEAGRIGEKVARGAGRMLPVVGAAMTAADIYDALNSPVQAGTLQPTDAGYRQVDYQDILPLIQLDNQGQPDYMLQGRVRQDNYLLPPDIQSGSFKAFYQNLKRNPYNTLMNIQETNNSSAGSNL